MVETILSNPLIQKVILPFLLVFALVFAVLQKAQIFGKEKKQIDAIIAAVTALLVVSVGYATNLIVNLIPFLAAGLVILLIFFLLWGFAFMGTEFKVHDSVKWVLGGVAAVAVIIAVLYFTPAWAKVVNLFSGESSTWTANIIFIVVIIAAVVAVMYGAGGKKEGTSS